MLALCPSTGAVRLLALTLGLLAVSEPGRAAPQADPRRLWAYPAGVLVTSDGGRVVPSRPDDDGKGGPPRDQTGEELNALTKALEGLLSTCLSKLRAQAPVLAKDGARYGFTLDFTIASEGTVAEAALSKQPGTNELPPCAEAARVQLLSYRFQAQAEGRPEAGHVTFEGRILDNDEAKGRGFQYYEAETAWEQTLKTHTAWFACAKAEDCTVATEMCEVRGVNTGALAAYRQAMQARKKSGCRRLPEPAVYAPSCRRGLCAAKPK